MTAQEARKTQQEKLSRQTLPILKEIQRHVNKGLGAEYIYFYKPINEPTIKELKDLGYKVEFMPDFRDGDFYKISW